jgi:hypothetical protein
MGAGGKIQIRCEYANANDGELRGEERTHLFHVVDEQAEKERLVAVVQVREEDVLAERVALVRVDLVELGELRRHVEAPRRHETTQS